MTREELKDLVLNSLLSVDANKEYFKEKMINHLNSMNKEEIYSAPVNPNYLEPIDAKHSIVLEENVYDALETIDQYNIDHKKEVPFILYGYETKGGAMAAVLNASEEVLKAGLEAGNKVGYVDVANYNSPAQVVITGAEDAVKATSDYLLANGVRRVVPLAVSGAFHSKFMESAGASFAEFISDVELNDASIPVITNVDAEPTISAEDFRAKMPKQIYSSVYWTQTIEKMVSEGVDTFIEIGPGKVLAGLNKKIAPDANVYNVFDLASLEATVEALNAEMARSTHRGSWQQRYAVPTLTSAISRRFFKKNTRIRTSGT